MAELTLFYPATPEAAYLVTRDRSIPAQGAAGPASEDLVELVARRG